MLISEKLQNQIRYHCDRISKVEWSGVLFYTTEGGTYGDPEFKITAQEFYLMDIGTATFTSYVIDGAFAGMLMKNPQLRAMKMGHIHSHNNMDVFFSGTDANELLENSGCHNYYLSLIVNNVNKMVAQVAYRVHRKTTTTDEITYKAIDGTPIVSTEHNEVSDNTVMIYDCDIDKPQIPDEFTRSRFCIIRELKTAANAAKNATHLADIQKRGSNIGTYSREIKKPTTFNDFVKKSNEKELTPGNLWDSTTPEGKIPVGSAVDNEIRTWMIDLIGKGVQNQLLSQVLGNLNKKQPLGVSSYLNSEINPFNCFTTYSNAFPDDPLNKQYQERLKIAINMLNFNYSDKYSTLVNQIILKLKTQTP